MRIARALVLVAAACGGTPPPAPISNNRTPTAARHEPMAAIERTACFGWCPVYKVTVYRDGTVDYDGGNFVKTTGHATGSLAPDQIAALDELFRRHHYLDLRDAYEEYHVTDMPSVYTSCTPQGQTTKRVKHYLGDDSAPHDLTEVEDGIDRIVHIEQWIGTPEERQRAMHE